MINRALICGRLIGLETSVTKNGKDVVNMVIQADYTRYDGTQSTRMTQVKCFGRAAGDAKRLSRGQLVYIEAAVESRDFKGKWYTDVVAEHVSVVNLPAAATAAAPVVDDGERPF